MDLPLPFLSAAFAEPIGISFDARRMYASQVTLVKGIPMLTGATRLPRASAEPGIAPAPLTRDEVSQIVNALALQGVGSKRAVLAVPVPHAALTAIELPPRSSGAPLEQIAEMELARLQRVEPGTFELALWELPKVQNRAGRPAAGSYIAATATHASGESLSKGFDASGLAVMALVPESLAVAKAAATLPESRTVVSLAWNAMEIVVLSEEAKIVYHRALPELGLQRIHTMAMERMSLPSEGVDGALAVLAAGGVSPLGEPLDERLNALSAGVRRLVLEHAEFVAAEVERSLTYAARFVPDCEHKPIRLVGEGAHLAGLSERLAQKLGMEVAPLTCGDLVRVPGGSIRHLRSTDLAASLGAALWTQSASGRLVA